MTKTNMILTIDSGSATYAAHIGLTLLTAHLVASLRGLRFILDVKPNAKWAAMFYDSKNELLGVGEDARAGNAIAYALANANLDVPDYASDDDTATALLDMALGRATKKMTSSGEVVPIEENQAEEGGSDKDECNCPRCIARRTMESVKRGKAYHDA